MRSEGQNGQVAKRLPGYLQKQLELIPAFSLTMLEAPSGFGKTTAAVEFLRGQQTGIHQEYWYTCLGESPARAWDGICACLAKVDRQAAVQLKKIGAPTPDTLPEVAEAFRGCLCEETTFLVIDNFHLAGFEMPHAIIEAMAMHACDRLHILVITQPFPGKAAQRPVSPRILRLDCADFLFEKADTDAFFKQAGIKLSTADLAEVQRLTEGWVAALQLQLRNYRRIGGFENGQATDALIRSAIWSRLGAAEKQLLLRLSLLETFTLEQVHTLLQADALPEEAKAMLTDGTCIRYNRHACEFTLHCTLREFLATEFAKEPLAAQRIMWCLAGGALASRGQYFQAARYYDKAGNFHALLALPFQQEHLAVWPLRELRTFILNLIDHCPRDVALKYPRALLIGALQLLVLGDVRASMRLMAVIEAILEDPALAGLDEVTMRHMRGEIMVLKAFFLFNDVQKMGERFAKAHALLRTQARLFDLDRTWAFDQSSVLYMFWSRKAPLHQTLACMEQYTPLFSELSLGFNIGADLVMRAEALLMTGEDAEAETLCYKTLYLLSPGKQGTMRYAAMFTLMRIASLRGDYKLFVETLEDMKRRVTEASERMDWATFDLVRAFIRTEADSTSAVADWLLDPMGMEDKLFAVSIPFAQMIHVRLLTAQGKYAAALGASEAFYAVADERDLLLPMVYLLIERTIALNGLRRVDEARAALRQALSLALPDKVFLPFAERSHHLMPLLRELRQVMSDEEGMEAVLALSQRYRQGAETIKRQYSTSPPPLTSREQEIALLAQRGMTNKEISEALFISSETVKMAMKKIFEKLGIRSRVQLEGRRL